MEWSITLLHIWNFIKEWYWVPLTILYIMVIVTILIENRNPTKTIAWILVIVFLPFIGIVLYFFFGQKFKKDEFLNSPFFFNLLLNVRIFYLLKVS